MSGSDAVSETFDESRGGTVGRAMSLFESVAPKLARHAGTGNLPAVTGGLSLVRAARTFRKGKRKRGIAQALVGLFWVGVALAQRRSGGGRSGGSEMSDVVDTSPDVESAVEPGGRETNHATGEEVVDTTDADIEETDTAPEVDSSPEVQDEVDESDVDQRDVVGSDAADRDEEHEFSESGDAEGSESDEN